MPDYIGRFLQHQTSAWFKQYAEASTAGVPPVSAASGIWSVPGVNVTAFFAGCLA